jgi:DNA-binding LacI/PurR family transcriptional regulator
MQTIAKKYEQIRAKILQRHGSSPPGSVIPPEVELAREFGVSRVTVARALNDLVREGVLDRRQGKGTFIAQKQARERTQCIGVLCNRREEQPRDTGDTFYGQILTGIHDVLMSADYSMTTLGVRSSRTDAIMTPEEAAHKAVDGIIALGIMNGEYMRRLVRSGLPVVGVEFHFEAEAPTDYVVQQCEESTFEITRRLIEKGHRRIAFAGHSTRNINPIACPDQNSAERLAGVRRAFQIAGITPPEDIIFQPPHPYWKTDEDVLKHIYSRPEHPTAVICEHESFYPATLEHLRALGIGEDKYPEFVTFGGPSYNPALLKTWRLREDYTELGRIAGQRILSRIENPTQPTKTYTIDWRIEPPEPAK